jgi:predicted HTH transcriptional regulator
VENRSIPRNRGLAKIFHDIGFIEGWVTGFQRMVEGCAMNGNPKPELKEMTGAFVVKFTRRPASEGISEGIKRATMHTTNKTFKRYFQIEADDVRKSTGTPLSLFPLTMLTRN